MRFHSFRPLGYAAWGAGMFLGLLGCGAPQHLAPGQTPTPKPPQRAQGEQEPSPKLATAGQQLAAVFSRAGCRGCHRADGMASDTRLRFPSKNATAADFEALNEKFWELVDTEDPQASPLLVKPTKRVNHGGGEKIKQGSPEEQVLLSWLSEVKHGPHNARVLRDILVPPTHTATLPIQYEGQPSALRRLSRDEIVTTLQVLLGVAPLRSELPEDPRLGHGLLVTAGMPLLSNEVRALQVVIEDFAKRVSAQLLVHTGCSFTQAAQRECLANWATDLSVRVFRRALAEPEKALLLSLFDGAGNSPAKDTEAVQALLVTLFMSPSFLYRQELGEPIAGVSHLRALQAEEIAGRLAFLATLGPADSELLAAAQAGRLTDAEERVRQFERLHATALGKKAQVVFVLEWLGANEGKINQKSDRYKKDLRQDFEAKARQSAEGTIARVLFESKNPTVAELLLSTSYLSDEAITKVIQPGTDTRRPTGDTETTGRMGLLMHPQVLAAHTKENGSSPFQLGAFFRDALLCEPVPPPPPDAAAMARTNAPPGLSTRENLEFRTSVTPVCVGCHQSFSPLGYAFLPFDPVGRWMKHDRSAKEWDLAGSVTLSSGEALRFSSPAELVRKLANHTQVHSCFAQAAVKWAFGRALVPADELLVSRLSTVAQNTHGNVPAIFHALVSAPEFMQVVTTR
ncbi:MAG: DUF1588 domain-containing protein [Polyangiaceae bacterium]|nr:DUF1588 domain-containing protein [Polyangiaceae bacterium]